MKKIVIALLFITLIAAPAFSLPFNDDMVNSPVLTGKIMRPAPDGVISKGSLGYHVSSREDALKFTNPIKGDKTSVINGKRLFQVNCSPCHGNIASDPYQPGTVTKFLPGPNLSSDMYHDKDGGRTDGQIYGVIHFGSLSGLMSPLGWKFSPTEHWDLINYIRAVQTKSAQLAD